MSENLPRFEIYQRLQLDPALQTSLLNVFSDIVEFAVLACRYFCRGIFGMQRSFLLSLLGMKLIKVPIVRLTCQIYGSFEEEFGDVIERLERHSKAADQTAIATEMHKAAEFRRGRAMQPCLHSVDYADVRAATELKDRQDLKMRCEAWLKPANMKAIHHFQVQAKLQGTCEWI